MGRPSMLQMPFHLLAVNVASVLGAEIDDFFI